MHHLLKTAVRGGALVLGASILITGLNVTLGSPLHQMLKFSIKQPLVATSEVVSFIKGIAQEIAPESQEQGKQGSQEEPGKTPDHKPAKAASRPEASVVAVLPSSDSKEPITVLAHANGQLVNVSVDRQALEVLKATAASAAPVHIVFTLPSGSYTVRVDKALLMEALDTTRR